MTRAITNNIDGNGGGTRMDMKSEKRSFNLPPLITEKFDELAYLSGASSHTEVVRDAIKLYIFLMRAECEGGRIIVRDADQREMMLALKLIDDADIVPRSSPNGGRSRKAA